MFGRELNRRDLDFAQSIAANFVDHFRSENQNDFMAHAVVFQ